MRPTPIDELLKVLLVIGTRPEAVKLAPVAAALREADDLRPIIVSTGQHREMLTRTLRSFDLEADLDLDIMRRGQSLAEITAAATVGLDAVLADIRPDLCLVQGDTTSAMCGALAAYYQHVPVGHVEAGLRTGDKRAPFPEEVNRRVIAEVADLHFAPTQGARAALLREGVRGDDIVVTGNTVIDVLLVTRDRLRSSGGSLPVECTHTVLVTAHRRESFGDGFEQICRAIRHLADERDDVRFVFPVHMNPRVREPVERVLGGHPRIRLLEPLSYEDFVAAMDQATFVLTDSGGVQEEAPSLGKPVLVMRDTTERPEGVAAGNARLVGTDAERIIAEASRLLDHPDERSAMSRVANPYGDGFASSRIVHAIRNRLSVDRLVPAGAPADCSSTVGRGEAL